MLITEIIFESGQRRYSVKLKSLFMSRWRKGYDGRLPPTRRTNQAAQIFDLCKGVKYGKIIFEISKGKRCTTRHCWRSAGQGWYLDYHTIQTKSAIHAKVIILHRG